MSAGRKNPPKYRRNPRPLNERGPRTFCEVSGFPTYEGRLTTDEEGQQVDPRYGGYDHKTGRYEDEGRL